jgi:hypothetical protein
MMGGVHMEGVRMGGVHMGGVHETDCPPPSPMWAVLICSVNYTAHIGCPNLPGGTGRADGGVPGAPRHGVDDVE